MTGLVRSKAASTARALTIAGSDSGGGAGIQADLKTFTVFGVYGTSVITAITAQNTRGVTGVYPLTADQVTAQLDAVLADIGTDAVKTGMLVDAPIVQAVADSLRRHDVHNVVVDPVMIAKSGDKLLSDQSHAALEKHLLPLAAVVTPNVPEAEVLTGLTIRTKDDMVEAGRRLLSTGCQAVLITGGHMDGGGADDVLVTVDEAHWFPSKRIDTPNTHGTGCTLSAAIAADLAKGSDMRSAVEKAKQFITDAIAHAPDLGDGHGPTNHLVWLERRAGDERQ